jgi:hypothetical protein
MYLALTAMSMTSALEIAFSTTLGVVLPVLDALGEVSVKYLGDWLLLAMINSSLMSGRVG